MFFKVPTIVYEEENCVTNHVDDLVKNGKNALIVTGRKSSRINGSLDDVKNALEKGNISYTIFDEVEENPSVETVMKASELGISIGADFVIGIGGGSPIDAAKAIAIMIANPDKKSEYLYEVVEPNSLLALPVVAVPTTCGTGSEVTGVSVLTVHEKRTKASLPHRVFPSLALLDAKYLQYAPLNIIYATAIDALGHLIESYINTTATEYSRIFVREGFYFFAKAKDVLVSGKTPDIDDLRNLLNASLMGGMAISHTGTTIPHSLSYSITYELGVPHGIAVGYFIPGYLREAAEEDREYILSSIGFDSLEEFVDFYKKTSKVELLPKENIEKVVEAVSKNKAKHLLCPYHLDKEVLFRIALLEG